MYFRLVATICVLLVIPSAWGLNFIVPEKLDQEILSDDSPTAWAPNSIEVENFTPEWRGPAIEGVTFKLGEKSFDWVRSMDVLALPRARLHVTVENAAGAVVEGGNGQQSLALDDTGHLSADIPVALLSRDEYSSRLWVRRNGQVLESRIGFKFSPQKQEQEFLVSIDPSCSKYWVKATRIQLKNSWAMIGCRFIYSSGDKYRTSSLALYVYWEGSNSTLLLEGVSVPPIRPGLWSLDLRSIPGRVTLVQGENQIELEYSVPEKMNYGTFSAGVGPYIYALKGGQDNVLVPTLMPTLYGSYFVTKDFQFVSFASIVTEAHLQSTLGLYLRNLSFRFLDRRVSLHINLGGHFLGFLAQGQYTPVLSFPQGMELKITDVLKKGHDFSFGGFFYPEIHGISYIEWWIRWGSSKLFGEINYIAWQQPVNSVPYSSQSLGFTFGIPIGGLL